MSKLAAVALIALCCVLGIAGNVASAQEPEASSSLLNSVDWPTSSEWRRVLLLEDYNTRVVTLGAMLLGCAGGMVGSFTLLRKRALMGDALSHATLPGIALAFILATYWGLDGKSLPILLLGATITGLLGVGTILLIRNLTRLKEDTALGAVLSVYFGAGVVLLRIVQQMKSGHAAGLESFIYGKTASMGVADTTLIAVTAACCIAVCLLLYKQFKLLCFDEAFAASKGLPVLLLDLTLMGTVVAVCIVGLQAVGLILMIALLVIPAAAARFWTEKMWKMVAISSALGATGGMVGAGVSALFAKLPSGAMIVLVCAGFFVISMVFGSARGLILRWWRRAELIHNVDRQHLLRAMFEILDATGDDPLHSQREIALAQLMNKRSWSTWRLKLATWLAARAGLLQSSADAVQFTAEGAEEAARLTRQHRLWELYLINYAEVAPGRVDQDADAIEHVLEPQVVARLETLLKEAEIPASPHELSHS